MVTQEGRFSNGMNPKTPQDLDPKLKEAYDRVMGGNFNPTPPASKIPEIPKTEPPPAPLPNLAVPPVTPLTNPMGPSQAQTPPLTVMSPSTADSTGQKVVSAKKKLKFSPIIFLIIGLAFFVVYAVVWGKVFKLF